MIPWIARSLRLLWTFRVLAICMLIAPGTGIGQIEWEATQQKVSFRHGENVASLTFTGRNIGVRSVLIREITESCTCASVSTNRTNVAPGESCELRVQLKRYATRSNVEATVKVSLDDGSTATLIASAAVPESMKITPVFVRWQAGSEPVEREMLVETGEDFPVHQDLVASSSDVAFRVQIERVDVRRWRARIKPMNTDTPRLATFTFEIADKVDSTAAESGVRVYAYAKIAPARWP